MTDNPKPRLLGQIPLPADLKRFSGPGFAARWRTELRAGKQCRVYLLTAGFGCWSGRGTDRGDPCGVLDTASDQVVLGRLRHQCYPHKILTGRRDRIRTLRRKTRLSGFTKKVRVAVMMFGAGP